MAHLTFSRRTTLSLALAAALLPSVPALASGTVSAQKGCSVVISGTSNLKKGDIVTLVTKDGTEKIVTINKVVKGKAAGKMEGSKCEGVKGATVKATDTGPSSEPAPSRSSSSGAKNFSVWADVGYLMGSAGVGIGEGDSGEISMTGLSYGGAFAYNVSLPAKLRMPIFLGVFAANQAGKVSFGGTDYDFIVTLLNLRLGAGLTYPIGSLELLGEGFFDYGVASKAKFKEEDAANTMMGGGSLGIQYNLAPVTIGLLGTAAFGQFSLSEKNASEAGDASYSAYGAQLRLAFSF